MTRKEIEQAERWALEKYLEAWGFQAYDSESTEELREAALQNHDTEQGEDR